MDIVSQNGIVEQEVSITLKEITDMLEVRHNNAMNRVEKLAEEPSFGVLRKTRKTSTEKGGRPIETYILNKKQAIAVGARLNNALLMKLIDRLEELEKSKNKPLSFEELAKQTILLAEERIQKLESKIEKQKPLVTYAETVSTAINGITIREWVGAMKQENGLQVGERKVINFLLDNKHLYRDKKNSLRPYSNQFDFFSLEPIVIGTKYGNKERLALKVTGRGQTVLTEKVIAHFSEKDAA
jgi:phage antirepressor YoqD-like protein